MGYLSRADLLAMGFKSLGREVRVSDRASVYDAERIELGDFTRIDDFSVVSGTVRTGRNVYVGPQCLVAGGAKGVTFGDFSTLAYQVKVFTQSDDYGGLTLTNPTVPAQYKQEIKAAIDIGRHVIIGAGSAVMPGVQLAEGCSVGAMSLVNRSTTAWGIYAGIPARRIKDRQRGLLEQEAAYLGEQLQGDT